MTDSMVEKIRAAIDTGGGQTCDIDGVIRELDKAGFVIVPREPTEAMYRHADCRGSTTVGAAGGEDGDVESNVYISFQDTVALWSDMISAALLPKDENLEIGGGIK